MNRTLHFLFAVVLSSAPITVLAETHYVSPNGNDSNPGTLSSPWKTIGKANQELRPGDTALLRGGNYDGQSIMPSRSGISESERITYRAYPGEVPVIRRISVGVELTGKQYITIDGVNMDGEVYRGKVATGWPGVNKGSSNIGNFAKISNSHYNIIRNVTWKYAHGWAGISLRGGSHNKILNSTFDFVGTYDNGEGDDKGDTLGIINSNRNLIEGSTFKHGGHNSLVISLGQFNVVRNNYFDGDFSDVEGPGAGARTVSLKDEGASDPSGYNLFENNVLVNTRTPTDSPSAPAMKVIGIGQIVRRNFIFNNDGNAVITANGSASSGYVSDNHIYHNVFYNNGQSAWALFFNETNGTNDNNVCVNNIIYANGTQSTAEIKYADAGILGRGNKTWNNFMLKKVPGDSLVFTGENKSNSLSWYENRYPQEFFENIQESPLFASTEPLHTYDFKLAPTSPAIDAGAYLTETTSSGAGQRIPVEDANFFSDGFGVIPGDEVRVGANGVARITQVDYQNETITVDRSLNWSVGDQVSLNFAGVAPDIGAFESGLDVGINPPDPAVLRPAPPQDLQATITN